MTDIHGKDHLSLAEVAELFAKHGTMRCLPSVEVEDESVTISIRLSRETAHQTAGEYDLEILDLIHEAQYLEGICQVRAFAALYNMDAEKLAALLPTKEMR